MRAVSIQTNGAIDTSVSTIRNSARAISGRLTIGSTSGPLVSHSGGSTGNAPKSQKPNGIWPK
jgi:hypothetical protein